jgi:hypothetical protein
MIRHNRRSQESDQKLQIRGQWMGSAFWLAVLMRKARDGRWGVISTTQPN